MRTSRTLTAALVALASAGAAQAQVVRIAPGARATTYSYSTDDASHAVIGVSLGGGSKRDTLGVLITAVTEGGPAEKAGLEEGNRIAAVNGISLKLSSSDAGEDDMGGVMTNRLMRELRKAKVGDEVTLTIYANGQTKSVKVKTTDSEDLSTIGVRSEKRARTEMEDRAVLGFNLGWSASRRDTLGVLIVGVEQNGPAEKAGIEEGFRVASVNGTDLRVAAADAGDDGMAGIKSSRFSREMRKVKVGDEVELKVYGDGRMRTVRVKAAKAIDVYPHQRGAVRVFMNGRESMFMPPTPPAPPMPAMSPMVPLPPRAPRAAFRGYNGITELDDDDAMDERSRAATAAMRGNAERMVESLRARDAEMSARVDGTRGAQMRGIESALLAASLATPRAYAPGNWVDDTEVGGSVRVTASGNNYTLVVRGMRLVPVSGDMTSYFGDGSDHGLLVLETGRSWSGLRDGDVLLQVNGKAVRADGRATIVLETDGDNSVAIIRKSKPLTVTVRARE
ncbi:MAG: PDZ domain-containing protein [Gemmatimonadaceae bacterium]